MKEALGQNGVQVSTASLWNSDLLDENAALKNMVDNLKSLLAH